MKKGEATRQEILEIADSLFCSKGYEATSIQDILHVLHGSKGGFYHHFPSKASVLETLCRERAVLAKQKGEEEVSRRTGAIHRINAVFEAFMPLHLEQVPFLSMLLPLLDLPEGMSIRVVYENTLQEAFLGLLSKEMEKGVQEGAILPVTEDLASPILLLLNGCWVEALMLINRVRRSGGSCSAAELQPILNRYRRVLESLLGAPFGTLTLAELSEWDEVAGRLTEASSHSET